MSKVVRPSVEHFRKAGWLPKSNEIYKEWIGELTKKIRSPAYSTQAVLLPPIEKFKEFVETNGTVYEEFIRMFEGVTEGPKNLNELLNCFNDIFRKAPYYGDLGPPMYMTMARIMNTQGGFSAFTKDNLNLHFKKLFDTWVTFLSSKDSRYVLVPGKFDEKYYGWFSDVAKSALLAEYNKGRTFEQVFICDPQAEYHGYTSYDDFFNRRYREVEADRPVEGGVGNLDVIGAPCEANCYFVQEKIDARSSDLFIKDESYSLLHLLANDPLLDNFVGGKIIQGFLNTTGYHRWHSPVTGTILKIISIPGTYFAQAPSHIGGPIDSDADLPPYLKSLRYFANVAARLLIFIQPDNPDIGLLCFIAIGMTEISTCEATSYDGQHLQRGDELGMFHFGGSSFAVVFSKDSKTKIDGKFVPGTPIKINELIAAVNK